MKFSTVFTILAVAVISVAADFSNLKNEIGQIQASVSGLHNALVKTAGTSYAEGLQMDQAAKKLGKDLDAAATSARSVKMVSRVEAQAVLKGLEGTYHQVSIISARLVALKPAWSKLGVAAVAKADLAMLAGSTRAFGKEMVAIAPAPLKSSAAKLADKYNAAMTKALDAY
ncbi:hypothetical protein OC835_005311 [Tilletia horrida]|uniref:Cell wall mannoprotein 1 n=1 Tax=Tilletia horrida TaxID=155126 RepID=A0AAN6GHJ2_9BASI|nr:hypothetical protein OC835_005311 [Tilletia horrida]KAK0537953.1 hypothetical protein OC842_001460 [Tilletia horrida]KAK0566742.1 hypothetical protein OC844_000576 [Tilletia horrida]